MRTSSRLKPLKYLLKEAVLSRVPDAYWLVRRWLRGPLEAEIDLLPAFADRSRLALDVGANFGAWSRAMLPHFAGVHAFEPQPRLARMLAAAAPKRLVVHQAAVSDRCGRVTLRVPALNLGRSTIDDHNRLDELDDPHQRIDAVDVPMLRLDDLALGRSVAFIKIDVEGHEVEVLRGAAGLLAESRPAVFVESEERHHAGAPAEVRALMVAAGFVELALAGRNLLFIARSEAA